VSHVIECIFTLDYEIYGNGQGSLDELVYEPTVRLKEVFAQTGGRMVVFVETAELERIEESQSDSAIRKVKSQIRALHGEGHEIALHLHPQWYNGSRKGGQWHLDYEEYNLCVLQPERISHIIDQAARYLQVLVGEDSFVPFSFRAGNWLLQPTRVVAQMLWERGIKVDSSVFKGGLQRRHGLDYRPSLKNGYYWWFSDEVNLADPAGFLLEVPIHTRMVFPWNMITGKRVGIQRKGSASMRNQSGKLGRFLDYARFRHPLKFDFCRMTTKELTGMIDEVFAEDRLDPDTFRPLVAIGHTKDLQDVTTVQAFLRYLAERKIPVSTFREVYPKCTNAVN
jgi:hypothetical protein